MNITPISNKETSFGLNIKTQTRVTSPLSKVVVDKISLNNGQLAIISTNYLKNQPTDRLLRLFDKYGKLLSSKLKIYNSQNKKSMESSLKQIKMQ